MTEGLPAADCDTLTEVDELRTQVIQIHQVCVDHQEELLAHRQALHDLQTLHDLQELRDNILDRVAELDLSLAGVSDNTARHGKAISTLAEQQKRTSQTLDAVVRAVKRLARSRSRGGTSGSAPVANCTSRARSGQQERRANHSHRQHGEHQENISAVPSRDVMEERFDCKAAEACRAVELRGNDMAEEDAHHQHHFQHEQRRRGTEHHEHHDHQEHYYRQKHHRDRHQRHDRHEHHGYERYDHSDYTATVASSEQQFLDCNLEEAEQHMLEEVVGNGDGYVVDAMNWGGRHPRRLGVVKAPHQLADDRGAYWSESSSGSESQVFQSGPACPSTPITPIGGVGHSVRPCSNPSRCCRAQSEHYYDAGMVPDQSMEPHPLPEPRSRAVRQLQYESAPHPSPRRRPPSTSARGVDHAATATGAEMVTCVNGVLARINEALTKIDNGIREVGGPDHVAPVNDSEQPVAFDSARRTHPAEVVDGRPITQHTPRRPQSANVPAPHGRGAGVSTPRPMTPRVNDAVETRYPP